MSLCYTAIAISLGLFSISIRIIFVWLYKRPGIKKAQNPMSSSRLTKYLHTLDRLPAITDVTTVHQIIEASGCPVFEPVIEFHCKYAGFVQPYGRLQ